MSSKGPWSNAFVTPLTLLMIIMPIIALVTPVWPAPTVSVELGEESDDLESLSLTSEPYSPESIVTLINDSAIESGNIWRILFDRQNDATIYSRYVNVPLQNATEVIFGASFNVEIVPRRIGIFNDRGSNSTTVLNPQNTTLILKLQPELFQPGSYSNLVSRIETSIEIEGEHLEGIEVASFWLQAVFDSPVYPVTVDIQRTNGVSLYSNPMMRNVRSADMPSSSGIPKLEFKFNNSVDFGFFAPTQSNDTVMLPSGNYTVNFVWTGYNINSSIYLVAEINHLVWQVRSVRIDVRATSNVSNYGVDFHYSAGLYTYLISEEPSIFTSPEGNRTILIRYYSLYWQRSVFATTSVGRNQNVTFLVHPNLITIGPIAIPHSEFILVLCFLLMVCVMIVGLKSGTVTLNKALPFSLLVLSYIVPWVHYLEREIFPNTILHEVYHDQIALYPGSSLVSITTPDSLSFMVHDLDLFPVMLASIFLLIVAYAGVSMDQLEQNHQSSNGVFAVSSFLILCLQLFYLAHISSLETSYNYIAVVPGMAPFIVVISMIMWYILDFKRRQKSHVD